MTTTTTTTRQQRRNADGVRKGVLTVVLTGFNDEEIVRSVHFFKKILLFLSRSSRVLLLLLLLLPTADRRRRLRRRRRRCGGGGVDFSLSLSFSLGVNFCHRCSEISTHPSEHSSLLFFSNAQKSHRAISNAERPSATYRSSNPKTRTRRSTCSSPTLRCLQSTTLRFFERFPSFRELGSTRVASTS